MLSGIEFQTVGAAYLKALRPTAVLVNGTCRKLCDADRRVLEGVLRLMRGERYAGETVYTYLVFDGGCDDGQDHYHSSHRIQQQRSSSSAIHQRHLVTQRNKLDARLHNHLHVASAIHLL